jgi:acyl-CoA synthetase (AMP-forming)/AMP-acid ligase II
VISCGPAVDGVRIEVRDATGRAVDENEIGEIHITSTFLFAGYYLQDDLTREKLRDGWYRTGDIGFRREGELYVLGRVDDMLIVNGRNFYAHEIESLVNEIDGIAPGRAVAIGVDDDRSDATVVIVLAECRVPATGHDELSRTVRQSIFERLGLAVHAFVPLASGQLVKTTSGKISRSMNKELYEQGAFSSMDHEGTAKA